MKILPRVELQVFVLLEAGIANHCLGSKIVDIHVCNFNNEICFTTKVPLQVASAPCMMHPTTHRNYRNTPATAFELRSLNCNSVTDLASAKGTAILTHRINLSHRLMPLPFRFDHPFGRYSRNAKNKFCANRNVPSANRLILIRHRHPPEVETHRLVPLPSRSDQRFGRNSRKDLK